MTAYSAVNAALYLRLSTDATLLALLAQGQLVPPVYADAAPDNAVLPFVVFSHHTGVEPGLNAQRDFDELLYVRAYAAAPSAAGVIDARLEALLHMLPLAVAGFTNIRLVRETDIALVETDEAFVKTWNVGALYRSRIAN